MIDVKEAVKKAREYLIALYSNDKLYDVDLEEVERDPDEVSAPGRAHVSAVCSLHLLH